MVNRFILLMLLVCCAAANADTFILPQDLSSSCKIEVSNYESETKSAVQSYVSGISVDYIQDLLKIRETILNQGQVEVQQVIDSKLANRLNILLMKDDIPTRDLERLSDVKEVLLTNPLILGDELSNEIFLKFRKLGL